MTSQRIVNATPTKNIAPNTAVAAPPMISMIMFADRQNSGGRFDEGGMRSLLNMAYPPEVPATNVAI